MLGGVAAVSRFLGNVIRQVPLISESPIDEALLDAGDQLDNMSSGWGEERLKELTAEKRPLCDALYGEYSHDRQAI